MAKANDSKAAAPLMRQAWWPLWPFLLLLAGAAAGYWFLLRTAGETPRFQEISWNRPKLARSILDTAIADLEAELRMHPPADTVRDSLVWKTRGEAERSRIRNRPAALQAMHEFRRRLSLMDPAMDSQLAKGLYIYNAESVLPGLGQEAVGKGTNKDSSASGKVSYQVSRPFKVALVVPALPDSLVLPAYRPLVYSYSTPSFFFNQYPAFGLWLVLLFMQLCLFGALLLPVVAAVYFPPDAAQRRAGVRLTPFLKIVFTLAIALLVTGFYFGFIADEKVDLLPEVLFMIGRKAAFQAVNMPGYMISGLCMVGFLLCGSTALQLRARAEAEPGEEELVLIRKATARLEKTFQFFFVVLGLLLSLAVFTTAVYFQGLNDLDFVRQLSRQLGRPAIRQDWVLLYGLVHCLLILLFYLPLRFLLDQLPRPEQASGAAEKSGPFSGLLASPLKSLLNGFIATSPLLAGLLQSFLEKLLS